MMTRVLLTFLVGLVVSLGTLVSGVEPVLAKNWNLSAEQKEEIEFQKLSERVKTSSDRTICKKATVPSALHKAWENVNGPLGSYVKEAKRRGLTCGVGQQKVAASKTYDEIMKDSRLKGKEAAASFSDKKLCYWAASNGVWHRGTHYADPYVDEAKRRGLNCGVSGVQPIKYAASSDKLVCSYATIFRHGRGKIWDGSSSENIEAIKEAKRRGLTCGVSESWSEFDNLASLESISLCNKALIEGQWDTRPDFIKYVQEAKRRGLNCGLDRVTALARDLGDYALCKQAIFEGKWDSDADAMKFVQEAKRRGLSCGVSDTTQTASAPKAKPKVTSAALTAAEKEAERLRQELAALRAEKAKQQQTISSDNQKPTIQIAGTASNGPQGTIKGFVRDNTGIAEVRVDGKLVKVDSYGNFMANTYVPEGGVSVSIQAIDLAGLSSSMSVRLDRAAVQTAAFRFDRLNPLNRRAAKNRDAVAIIVGVSDYKETTARAAYADSDAKVFQDYAIEKLGVPSSRIKTLVNDGADEKDMLLAVKRWLARASKQGKTDVYVFFAGHGLASDDGEKMYLLPYDGSPELLDDTAILRDRLFTDIASAKPRSVTVFLDTCYSGTTRGTDMLIASRPIAIKALKQSVPDNFTVFTAAAGDQTAKPLEEAKHGMFSYFLMKGMEGEADQNQDNKITAGELHAYVKTNVQQQSSGSQTPELQGDSESVLVRFQ